MSLMEFEFLVDGTTRTIGLENRGRTFVFRDGETVLEAEVRRVSANELLFRFGGRTARVYLARDDGRTFVSVAGREFIVTEAPPGQATLLKRDEKTPERSLKIKAPMPGKVIHLSVREGDEVRRNQALLIVEAMKMENEIQSPVAGLIKKVHTAVGDFVDSEKPLIEIESKE
jgi:biotin carboxyl carrier protein